MDAAAEFLVRQSFDREGGFEKGRFEFPADQPQPPLLRKPVPIHTVLDPLKYPLFFKYVLYGGVKLPGIPLLKTGVLEDFVEQQRQRDRIRYRENGDPAAWIYGGRPIATAAADMNRGMFEGERGFHPGWREWFVVCRFHSVPKVVEYQPWTAEEEAELEQERAGQVAEASVSMDYLVPA